MNRPIAHWLIAAALFGASVDAADLTVTVTGVRELKGTIQVAVVDSEAAWNDAAERIAVQVTRADSETASLRFTGLPPGTYAVQVMHDENDDNKLNTNFAGIPIEGYGFSNNPRVMRRPNFDEASFRLAPEGSTVVVRLH